MKKKTLYVYVKGNRYNVYKVEREEDEEFMKIEKEFETFEDLMWFVVATSNTYSIPVRIFY